MLSRACESPCPRRARPPGPASWRPPGHESQPRVVRGTLGGAGRAAGPSGCRPRGAARTGLGDTEAAGAFPGDPGDVGGVGPGAPGDFSAPGLLGRGLRPVEEALHHQGGIAAGGQGEGDVELGQAAVQLIRRHPAQHQLLRLHQQRALLVLEVQQPLGAPGMRSDSERQLLLARGPTSRPRQCAAPPGGCWAPAGERWRCAGRPASRGPRRVWKRRVPAW